MKMTQNIRSLLKLMAAAACVVIVTGCAGVPMAPADSNSKAKSFAPPGEGKSGLYIYRDSFVGKALKKDIYVDGKCLGETADRVFFYTQVGGDQSHKISTESEFGSNDLLLNTDTGKNYFVRQFIKMGVFVGGAGVENVSEDEGRRVISKPEVNLAVEGRCGS
ncbi:MAG TPA: DUF2846 domain-containing protein [Candidimonas sp.]|nr:DUF2846 domain-containing protein [Candidimonas sp.]